MSKVLGIIAEYNPFHNGHSYHLEQAKKASHSDYTIAVMSGNFTQRGEPAIIDKWSRAKTALLNGVDLVIELPALYAVSSAENYAEGAIKLLDSLGVVDAVAFGTETADIDALKSVADVLAKEPESFKNLLEQELKSGISFPKARENALLEYFNSNPKYQDKLSTPNNILAIEYLKALKKINSKIKPIAIKRVGASHNDIDVSGNISSASAIRNLVADGAMQPNVSNFMPASSYSILREKIKSGQLVTGLGEFEKEIVYILRRMKTQEIQELQDVSEGLENLIKKAVNTCNSLPELIGKIQSKRFTQTRIQRILLYSLLGITKKDIEMSKKVLPYARILGFNKKGKQLISKIASNNPEIEIVTSVKKFLDECSDELLKKMLKTDIFATDIYTLGFEQEAVSNLDLTKKIVMEE